MRQEPLEILSTLGTLTAGYHLFGWNDYYHVALGMLALGGLCLLVHRGKKRQPLRTSPARPNTRRKGQRLVGGMMRGAASLGFLGLIFFPAVTYSPLHDWVYGWDCPALLEQAATLKRARAWEGIVDLVDQRLQKKTARTCRTKLLLQKYDALVAYAGQLPVGEERIAKLEEAGRLAAELAEKEKTQSITTKLQDLQEHVRAQAEITGKRDEIAQEVAVIARNKTLLEALRRGHFDAWQEPDGVLVRLPKEALFALNSADVSAATRPLLAKLAAILNRTDVMGRTIQIEGHSDLTGDVTTHQPFSKQRAQSVAEMLSACGVNTERLVVRGHGSSQPLSRDQAAQARNRRVDIRILN
jgi:outer membrane protein OmpA-like peptidoglycan-associated protein